MGYLMKGTGFEDILVEAGICLRGTTANKIMAYKDYYAMLMAHSLVNAAMFELRWEAFELPTVTELLMTSSLSLLPLPGMGTCTL
jgi:hypothetical protein